MTENKTAAKTGGRIARQARNQLESETGKSVVTGSNYLPLAAKKLAKKSTEKPVTKALKTPQKP
jgi:hypothetical protein